ncbi:MAG: hypothetical protein HOY79_20670 [Streptomyces sp.]|nr:hypothetical protein [Streptomyces sp.]
MAPARKSAPVAEPAETPATGEPRWFRYVGTEARTYLFADAPAIAAEHGGTHLLREDPGDGAWEPCPAPDPTPASTDTAE